MSDPDSIRVHAGKKSRLDCLRDWLEDHDFEKVDGFPHGDPEEDDRCVIQYRHRPSGADLLIHYYRVGATERFEPYVPFRDGSACEVLDKALAHIREERFGKLELSEPA
jgi:hypothetical protein